MFNSLDANQRQELNNRLSQEQSIDDNFFLTLAESVDSNRELKRKIKAVARKKKNHRNL